MQNTCISNFFNPIKKCASSRLVQHGAMQLKALLHPILTLHNQIHASVHKCQIMHCRYFFLLFGLGHLYWVFFYCLLFQYIPAECSKSNSFLYCHLFVWNVKWCAQVQFFNILIKRSIVVPLRLAHCLHYKSCRIQFSCFLSKLSWMHWNAYLESEYFVTNVHCVSNF